MKKGERETPTVPGLNHNPLPNFVFSPHPSLDVVAAAAELDEDDVTLLRMRLDSMPVLDTPPCDPNTLETPGMAGLGWGRMGIEPGL